MAKERLDKILVDLGYFETKSKASASILAGQVKVNDEVITKAGYQLDPEKDYEFVVKSMPYVSRGGFKLQKALAMDSTTKSVVQADMFTIPDETNWNENELNPVVLPPTGAGD